MAYLIPVAVFVMVVFIVWFDTRQKQTKIQARAELNRQLLDKFGTAQELTEFLERDAGQRFLDGVGEDKRHGPKEQILGMITGGCITMAIGIGFFFVSAQRPDLEIPAAILFAVGAGLFVAAAISYVLSKKWGLMKGKGGLPGRAE